MLPSTLWSLSLSSLTKYLSMTLFMDVGVTNDDGGAVIIVAGQAWQNT
jgi:hypothetical protein